MPMPNSPFSSIYQMLPDSVKNLVKRIIQDINPNEIILFGNLTSHTYRDQTAQEVATRILGTYVAEFTLMLGKMKKA
jgi:electron transfer flavoprotein alpha/beta subunit